MREIRATEAENSLGEMLDWVEGGDEVLILRGGRPIARLIAPFGDATGQAARAAADIRAMSKGVTLGGLDIRSLIDEGRR